MSRRPGAASRRPGGRLGRLLRWPIYLVAGLALALLALQGWYFVQVLRWKHENPGMTSFMAARLDALRDKDRRARLSHAWVPYSRISIQLKRAIIAAEDAKFIDHEGFDWAGIQHALDRNRKIGKVVAGGSTITQQLAKNLFLSGERSMLRKAQEAAITAMLEAAMDKRRILEIYLNVVEWGEGLFGAEAAALHYFGIPASQLSQAQAAQLAAMLPRPRYYQRNRGSPYLAQYSGTILARMEKVRVP